jgi:hypothetical protein
MVFPSVVFRPLRLLVICGVLGAVAVLVCAHFGHIGLGAFFAGGLLLGLVNALLVRHSAQAITAQAHPLKRRMALNSAMRLFIMTAIGVAAVALFRPAGIGVVVGMAVFQILLVMTTVIPAAKATRAAFLYGDGSPSEGMVRSDD